MKNLSRTLFQVFILFAGINLAAAQNPVLDSLQVALKSHQVDTNKVNTLVLIANRLTASGNYESSLEKSSSALALSQKLEYTYGKIASLEASGTAKIYINKGEALEDFFTALAIGVQSKNKAWIHETYSLIAQAYLNQENYAEAIEFLYKVLKFGEETGNMESVALSMMSIGYAYLKQSNHTQALPILEEALRKFEEVQNNYCIAQVNIYLGIIYADRDQYSEALKVDSTALIIFQRIKNTDGIAQAFSSIGVVFEREGKALNKSGDISIANRKFLEARENYLKALALFTETNSVETAMAYQNLGNINIHLKNYREARNYLENALSLDLRDNWKDGIKETYLSLSILDSSEEKYEQALKNYKLYILYRDSIINESTATKLTHAKLSYEFEKKEAMAKAEQDKKDANAARMRVILYSIIALFLMLALFLFWNNRQKQKAKLKIEKAYSELESTQAQLIQSEKMASLGELTAGVAHEIQNPLNFVNNFSEVSNELIDEMREEFRNGETEEGFAIADDIKQNLEKIIHHGKRADAIVKGMLEHSRTSSGERVETDINALCDEYLRLSYHGLRAKDKSFNAAFETDFDPDLPMINVVAQDIGRVLLNLINNAFYAVNERSKEENADYHPIVGVITRKRENGIEISVEDNGNGIPQHIKDKIFQPFFTTKPTGKGTGLGLSLSYDIVKAHGGELLVESTEGKGTEFKIIIFHK